MNWYLQSNKDSDIVISSRVRLVRNIKGIPFTPKCKNEDFKKVYDIMKENSPLLGYGLKFIDLKDLDDITKYSLAEKHLINTDFAKSKNPYAAIIINDDEDICIEINEEDHIKIQVFSAGLEIQNLMNLAIEIDQKLEDIIPISYHEQYGYLTSCPTNVGTGLKSSVIVHLPALSQTRNIRKILNIVNNFGMSIKNINSEGSKIESDIYQISNNQTLGITEKEVTKNINLITQKVIEQERVARKYLAEKSIELEDELYRNYGILVNARKISGQEALELLSNVKLGVDLGIITEINDKKILELMLYIKPANLQKRLGKKLNMYDRQIERAKLIKEIIAS